MSNAIFVHMNDFNHPIDWDNSKEILFCSDIIKRNIIESSIIKVKFKSTFNVSTGMYKLDNFIMTRIVDQLSIK